MLIKKPANLLQLLPKSNNICLGGITLGTIEKVGGFHKIYSVSHFFKDFEKVFNSKAKRPTAYDRWLNERLHTLDEAKRADAIKPKFEHLSNETPPLWSIRTIKGETPGNARVLFAFFGDNDNVLLLCPFYEKASSDYTAAKAKAKARFKGINWSELEEEQ
ncbi:MAG: hypothetical protein LBM28_07335 [Oscillospiraceae bacterium]|jgi:hypothetical protein|nr:hypothetical protein [Oscillospiraceae bacterium]